MQRMLRSAAFHCLLAALLLGSQGPSRAQIPDPLQSLKVAPDGRHLVTASGGAFFLLGDTAWNLFYKVNDDGMTRQSCASC
jgi:hypothetical protein